MKKTSVDILVTYWGDYELLMQTINSVYDQTSDDWHLYIFDDCYPDKKAFEYFNEHPHPKTTYIRHARNLGITNNFNFAINASTAQYCILLGCDDILLPTYIETALNNIGEADFYQPTVNVIDASGREYLPLGDRVKRWLQPNKAGYLQGESLASSLCHGNWLYFPSLLWKTNTIQQYGFNEKYKIVEDVQLELEIISDGGVLFFDTTPTFQYRRFANSLSSKEKSKTGVRFNEERDVYTMFAQRFQTIGWRRAALAARLRVTSRINNLLN